jgi:hypothetical protein
VEDHVRAVAGIATRRAEGHYLARVRLSGRGGEQATGRRPRRRPSASSSAAGGGRSVHAARLLGHVVSGLVEAPLHVAAPLTRRWG